MIGHIRCHSIWLCTVPGLAHWSCNKDTRIWSWDRNWDWWKIGCSRAWEVSDEPVLVKFSHLPTSYSTHVRINPNSGLCGPAKSNFIDHQLSKNLKVKLLLRKPIHIWALNNQLLHNVQFKTRPLHSSLDNYQEVPDLILGAGNQLAGAT